MVYQSGLSGGTGLYARSRDNDNRHEINGIMGRHIGRSGAGSECGTRGKATTRHRLSDILHQMVKLGRHGIWHGKSDRLRDRSVGNWGSKKYGEATTPFSREKLVIHQRGENVTHHFRISQ